MAKRKTTEPAAVPARRDRPSALIDTRVIYCGDCLDQLCRLPDGCVDLVYIDPPFNSNRNYEVFWGRTSEPRAQASGLLARFEDRHASTAACIDYMRPRCVGCRLFVPSCRRRLAAIPRYPHPLACRAADRLLCPDQH
jgi:hypothetical protein